ncbi:nucleotidyltransferase domain-containing protein [Jeotgalibaca ciconiae]|uniref:Nucleotidyltransferase domain-containing protein n=1 Tax=Jeotgalibaca ciconiae TaxID=2496265 RepID=A0A3Q9BMS1_9LACT|nr:nucleotidyltransferase domain-containing protein [Jeotgalibaca ciconiae]AZP04660.1 nucleotidyltransferase domain-containing protein [Jeotgalibaca ciconiae]HJB24487.1 nucleotidyltransferase domain-containing protein [Candidatus Jeotgalibaca pullicola]
MDVSKWISVLSEVDGIDGIVLGGSKSRGEADIHSDTDIGVYYHESINWDEFEEVLRTLSEQRREGEKVLFLPGEWGPWVNGGAWLTIAGDAYDVILRDTKRVKKEINECLNGTITIDYQVGHPFGYVNTIYAAEVHYAEILWEKESRPISQLKNQLHSQGPLPSKMKEASIDRFLFEAQFSMDTARKAVLKGDVHYVNGCFFRTVSCWNQVLYALNDRFMMNEKGSLKVANQLPISPEAYLVRVYQAYQYFSEHNPQLGFEEFELLQTEIVELINKNSRK